MKKLNLILLYSNKMSWNFSKKKKCDNIIKNWHDEFKTSSLKGKIFLNLLNNNLSDIEPSYTKGELWIKSFKFSNSFCAWATWAITNHAPIEEYWLCFFLREEFSCLCKLYSIETRHHVLYDYKRFNKGWNLGKEILFQFIFFLEYNLNAFSFRKSITWACNSFVAIALYIYIYYFSFYLVLFNVVTK